MTKRSDMIRERLVTVLKRENKPLSAYDLLESLRPEFPKIAPPTVYRALAKLSDDGAVHRIESMNAFVACAHSAHVETSIMSICDACGAVEERVAPEIIHALSHTARESGFETKRHVVELHGQCADCGSGDGHAEI